MPFKLQRIPQGMLSLLGIFGEGRNPDELVDGLRGTVDLEAYFLAREIVTQQTDTTGATTAGSAASSAAVQIPTGEAWRIVAVMGQCHTPSAAGAIQYINTGINVIPGNTVFVARSHRHVAAATNDQVVAGWLAPTPLVLTGGTILRTTLAENVGGALTVSVRTTVLFYRLTR